jgi:5-(carboxyamino)imidazole ribonucleotide synthase
MRIGILGGGQLARMMIEETSKYGFEFVIYSEEANSPAGKICNKEITGKFSDTEQLNAFCKECDIVTLENEFIDRKYIEYIEQKGKVCLPGSEIVGMIQDKFVQKQMLGNMNIPVPEFEEVNSTEDIKRFASAHGYPVILKSRTMGYDGKGNYKIDNESGIKEAYDLLGKRGNLMCEEFIDFQRELAVQIVRSSNGEVKVYPVVESVQKNHICHLVKADNGFIDEVSKEIKRIAIKLVDRISYVGVLAVELFQMENGKIYVNELAPRVHNTGHYTIEGCYTSQFENHILAILGLPLGLSGMKYKNAVMINLIGERNGKANLKGYSELIKDPMADIHFYGKDETRVGRKMGHITVTGDDMEVVLNKAQSYLSQIKF